MSLSSCSRDGGSLDLPCQIGALEWHMSERALRTSRPNIRWSSSDERYHENLEGCEPFITHVSYQVSRWRGLTRIGFSRELTVATPADFEALIPGFLHGAHVFWGEPASVEVFPRPTFRGVDYWHVGLAWKAAWGKVWATYSSPKALFPNGHEWHAAFEVEYAVHGLREPEKPWFGGNSEPTLVARHFEGFPVGAQIPTVYLH